MNKLIKAALAATMTFGLVACSSSTTEEETKATSENPAVETSEAEEEASTTGVYKLVNKTGEDVTALYVYETGASDKGENYAETALAADADVEVTYEAESADTVLTLEFTTASGYTGTFTTLSIEEATINLLAEADVETGATQIEFAY